MMLISCPSEQIFNLRVATAFLLSVRNIPIFLVTVINSQYLHHTRSHQMPPKSRNSRGVINMTSLETLLAMERILSIPSGLVEQR